MPADTELTRLLAEMASAVATAMQRATTALLERRERLAHNVIAGDAAINALRLRVEEVATDALLFHAPVAAVAAFCAADELKWMGDLALDVAEYARRAPPVSAAVAPHFAQMGWLACAMARKIADVARTGNVLLVTELDDDEDAMDELHRRMFGALLDPAWADGMPTAVELTLLARRYERYADHAVLVGRQIVYAVTGQARERKRVL